MKTFHFSPTQEGLECWLSKDALGFTPERIWNPSPARDHRTEPYPVPQALEIGVLSNELTSAKFSPPPMAVVLEGGGLRWYLGIAAEAGWHRWNSVRFEATSEAVHLSIDLEGETIPASAAQHIEVLLVGFGADIAHLEALASGLRLQYPEPPEQKVVPEWWLRPIYCGWGDQVAFAMAEEGVGKERRAMAYCIQGLYERWISRLEEAEVPVGTVIVDGGWSLTGVWQADEIRWPEMKEFIRRQHEAGRKVLLWLGTWLWDGLAKELSILGDGRQWVADPTNPRYIELITQWITEMLSPEGLDADGFKIDQLGFSPNRRSPRWCPRFGFLELGTEPVREVQQAGEGWGIELLYLYQKAIYQAAKAAKPDCLITSSTVHPYFRDTFDMVRLHDMGRVPPDLMAAMKARADLAKAALPQHPIDTDDWIHRDYGMWLEYTMRSIEIGVPCIFFTERFITRWDGEPATQKVEHLREIGEAWRAAGHRSGRSAQRMEIQEGEMAGYQSE